MARFRPVYGFLVVPIVVAGLFLVTGGFHLGNYQRVSPNADGVVRIGVQDLPERTVRYYRFLNRGNQEVKFFVGRDLTGALQVAFDASESHAKLGRGFRLDGDWIVDNKCESASRFTEVNRGGGGCRPVPLSFRLDGSEVVLAETDILKGWRLFN